MNTINFFQYGLRRAGTDDIINSKALQTYIKNSTGEEAYHCSFDLELDSLKVEVPTGDKAKPYKYEKATEELLKLYPRSVVQYEGVAHPALGYVWFDFDDKQNPDNARKDLLAMLSAINPPPDSCLIYFSGNAGFHLGVPFSLLGLVSSALLPKILNKAAVTMKETYKTLDTAVFNPQRKFRAPGSKNPKSGLYKIRLSEMQCGSQSMDEIYEMATSRGDLEIPSPGAYPVSEYMHKVCIKAEEELTPKSNEPGGFSFGMENLLHETYEPNTIDEPLKRCAFLKWNFESPEKVSHPDWYKAIGVVAWLMDGGKLCHDMSKGHPAYKPSETDSKIKQVKKLTGPTTCVTIASGGFKGCIDCKEKCKTPAAIRAKKESFTNESTSKENDTTETDTKTPEKPKKTPHFVTVSNLIKKLDGKFFFESETIFEWLGTHWKAHDKKEGDAGVKRLLLVESKFQAHDPELTNMLAMFKMLLPRPPQGKSFFKPDTSKINFLDGTFYVHIQPGNQYTWEFKTGHRKEDLITTCNQVNYPTENTPRNTVFDEFIDKVTSGPERAEKLKAIKQMYAAAIFPFFPRIFFCLGIPKTGKSTIAQVPYMLFGGPEVYGNVQPKEMVEFGLQSLLGKLVNIHTELDEHNSIHDDFIKGNEDRIPKMVNRKGLAHVQAFLPTTHIFCCNTLPPTKSKSLSVYNRRVTVIYFKNEVFGDDSEQIKFYENVIIDGGKEAIVAFAMEGVIELLSTMGKYTNPPSGSEILGEWQRAAGDSFDNFMEHLEQDTAFITGKEEDLCTNSGFYAYYEYWFGDSREDTAMLSKNVFFKRLNGLIRSGICRHLKMGRNKVQRFVSGVKLPPAYMNRL